MGHGLFVIAVNNPNMEMVRLLLGNGASLTVNDSIGYTPREKCGSPEIIMLLRKWAQKSEGAGGKGSKEPPPSRAALSAPAEYSA
jgi:hypothetical protein